MEIDITKFYDEYSHEQYSNNVATLGDNAGLITWNNALDCDFTIINKDNREEIEDYISSWGAWEDDEITAWSDKRLNALVIQFISGDIREKEGLSWEEYELQANNGQLAGNIFKGDNNRIYYYIGI